MVISLEKKEIKKEEKEVHPMLNSQHQISCRSILLFGEHKPQQPNASNSYGLFGLRKREGEWSRVNLIQN